MNAKMILNFLGIKSEEVEELKRVGQDAAEKAQESYERLKRIETMLERMTKDDGTDCPYCGREYSIDANSRDKIKSAT